MLPADTVGAGQNTFGGFNRGGNGNGGSFNPFNPFKPNRTRAPKPPAADPLATQPMFTPNPTGTTAAPLTAPMAPGETDVYNQLLTSLGQAQPGGTPEASTALNDTLSGKYLTPSANPFLAAAIQAAQKPVMDNFTRTIVPQLLSRFTGAGQEVQGNGSSPFAMAAANAANDLEQNLGNIGAQMSYQNYGQERQNQVGAISTANSLTNDNITRMVTGLQAAALPRLIQDMGIQRGITAFNNRVQAMLEALRIAVGASAPALGTSSASSGSQSTGVLPALGSFFGGFTGGG